VGQDWGGPVCTSVAARLPDRVRGIVLANTSVFVPSSFKATRFHRFARMRGLAEVAFIGLGFPQSRLASVQGDRGSISGIVARAYEWPLRRFRDRAGPLALARMVPDDIRHPTVDALRRGAEWLERFSGPLALVWGERDPILGRTLDRLAQRLPQATVTRTSAGHFLQEEVPQALVSAIVDVWRRAEPTRPARSV
jgi:pimeloyl-ACP methyl ester carboxylesterase